MVFQYWAHMDLVLTSNSRSVFRAGVSLNNHSFIHSLDSCGIPIL